MGEGELSDRTGGSAAADRVLYGLVSHPDGLGQLRAVAAVSTGVVEEARRRHDLWPTATAALGRTLTAALLMGATLKSGADRVMIQILGDGPLRSLIAVADGEGAVRGDAGEPHVHLPLNADGKLDVAAAVGKGHLYVTRDPGLREPYRGVVPLVSGEVAEDLAHYFARSEQTPAAVGLGVLVGKDGAVRAAGGFFLQALPGTDPNALSELDERAQRLPGVSRLIDEGAGPLELLRQVTGAWPLKVLGEKPVRFHRSCSRERFGDALAALGEAELQEMIEAQGEAELYCRFCGERYRFSEDALRSIIEGLRRPVH